MAIQTFEEIKAWQEAHRLTIDVYEALKDNRDFSFRDQIQRASVSVMNNIAEGFERKSNKEFKQFLYIAKGSCGEVRSMLRLGEGLGYVTPIKSQELILQATQISKMLSGFIKQL